MMPVDPEHTRKNAFDSDAGVTGQEYHRDREAAEGTRMPSGTVGTGASATPGVPADHANGAIPVEAGRRARFDPATGEVHGSGAGTGGGNPGENIDSDEDGHQ